MTVWHVHVLGSDRLAIWELTVDDCHNDFPQIPGNQLVCVP